MAGTYQLVVNGTPVDADLYTAIASLEIEENVDLPGAFQVRVPVDATMEGDLTSVADPTFWPGTNVAVVVTVGEGAPECIFDGYVLSHKAHLETGTTDSSLVVWGQDASWLMSLEEKVREWVDVTDAEVAEAIFSEYGVTPASENADDDSAAHAEAENSLMQRGTDLQFLQDLARRTGKLFRVSCKDAPGTRTGTFAKASLEQQPALTLTLNDPAGPSVRALDFEWDITRPTEVMARQAIWSDPAEDGAVGDAAESGLPPLDERLPADLGAPPVKVLLTAPAGSAGELLLRAAALLREAGFFVRCTGEADVHQTGAVLRAGTVVQINGAGSLYSGKYYVWSVRHTLTAESHKMSFVLVRNALGPAPEAGAAA